MASTVFLKQRQIRLIINALAQAGVMDLASHFVFILKLLDKSLVLVHFAHNMFQGIDLARLRLVDEVNAASVPPWPMWSRTS